MRNIDVIKAFIDGKSACGSNLYSTGDKLVNYNTCIAQYYEENNKPIYILNKSKYSFTTSKHQNALERLLCLKYAYKIIRVMSIPKNTLDLLKYGKYV